MFHLEQRHRSIAKRRPIATPPDGRWSLWFSIQDHATDCAKLGESMRSMIELDKYVSPDVEREYRIVWIAE